MLGLHYVHDIRRHYKLDRNTRIKPTMIESIKQLCKEQASLLESAALVTIHENNANHSDFLAVSFLLDYLLKGKEVTFVAVRENYAHFLALSRKMGKSIEEFGKSGKLLYYEAFASGLCSELPLTQSSPSSFVRPPKFVNVVTLQSLQKIKIRPGSIFIVDCLSFIEHQPISCYQLYEQATLAKCPMIIGGCSARGGVSQILKRQADVTIKLENDVSGHGKFTIVSGCDQSESGVLWKWAQGKFQLSKFMKI